MIFVSLRSLQTGLKTASFDACFQPGSRVRVSSSWLEILIVKYRLSNGSFLTFTPKKERPTACFFFESSKLYYTFAVFLPGFKCVRSFISAKLVLTCFCFVIFQLFPWNSTNILFFRSSNPKTYRFFEFICHYLVTRVLFTHELAIVFTPTGSPLLRPLCFCRSTPSTQFAWTIRLNSSLTQFARTNFAGAVSQHNSLVQVAQIDRHSPFSTVFSIFQLFGFVLLE